MRFPGQKAKTPADDPTYWRLPNRVAYVVSHSQPWSSNGYAARSSAVARALTEAGHEVIVFTRPGRPWDIENFPADAKVVLDRTIAGVRHITLPMPPLPGATDEQRLRATADVLAEAFTVFRPAAVIAASNWQNAEPARRAAARIGARFFYEQRGFWEMGTAPAEGPDEARQRDLETEIALGARAVFTLNAAMQAEMVRRGVPEGRIHLVPNGTRLPGRIDGRVTRASIGCTSRYLLGYIGSLSPYEGVEDLLHLVAHLRKGEAGLDLAALIIGSDAPKGLIGGAGAAERQLRDLAGRLGITPFVHFVPQLPEDTVASYYPLCDAIVLPRRRTRVTELVPPIKPYSAAAFGLPVFMSDLPPLAEIAAEIHGHVYPVGDVAALAVMVRKTLLGGADAGLTTLDPALDWSQRIRPMSRHLEAVAEAELARNRQIFGDFAATGKAAEQGGATLGAMPKFPMAALPLVGLHSLIVKGPVALIGPAGAADAGGAVARLNRANLLEVLATAEPGRFVIDWAGLQGASLADQGDWAGLWSIDDMRLNRQIMDAALIAIERGWRMQVLGPVHRSQAPLFRTVANVVEEILPAGSQP